MTHVFRTAKPPDAAWILDVAREAYGPERITSEAEAWVEQALVNADIACFLGQRSFGFVSVYRPFWEPKPVSWLMFFGARPGRDWESVALARHAAAYAASRGCAIIDGGTETASDVGILLRRIGAKPYVLYRLELPCRPF